jgi:hypothetical protein
MRFGCLPTPNNQKMLCELKATGEGILRREDQRVQARDRDSVLSGELNMLTSLQTAHVEDKGFGAV